MRIIRPVKVKNAGAFYRDSPGTYWDKNGVLQTAVSNVIRISYDPSDLTKAPAVMLEGAGRNLLNFPAALTSWFDGGSGAGAYDESKYPDPAGGNTASRWSMLVGSGKYIRMNGARPDLVTTMISGVTYTVSVFVRKVSGTGGMYLGIEGIVSGNFNFDTMTVSSVSSGCTAGVVNSGNGWYRLWFTFVGNTTINSTIVFYRNSGAPVFDVWGDQIEVGPLTSYMNFTGRARSPDFINPAAATNLAPYSQVNTVNWALFQATSAISSAAGASPDGSTTSVLRLANNGAGEQSIKGTLFTFQAGTTYTASVYAKADTATAFYGVLTSVLYTTSGGENGFFDLYAGTTSSSSGVKASMVSVGNGWFRCSWTFTPTVTIAATSHWINLGQGTTDTTKGMFFWGAQLEVGSVATPYIATTATAVTRAAITGGLVYSNVPENDYPVWSSTKQYITGDYVLDLASHKIYQSITGLTGTATFLTGQTNNIGVSMKKSDGTAYVPAVNTPVVFTGSVPTGVTSGTTYYVLATNATSFSIAASVGGAAIAVGTQATPIPATASANINIPVPNATYWLDTGYDNRWEMFDDSVTSQTTLAGDITVVFVPGARLDAIAGLNMAVNSMKVAFTELSTGGVTYNAKANLISNSGVQSFYAYLYEPIVQMPDCLIDAIPLGLSTNSAITVTFQSNGTSKVGGLVFGLSKDIGITEWGAKVGIMDYSVKTKDTFGNYTITPRAFSKRGDFTVQVPTGQVDALQNLLAQYRSTPIVYIGSNTGAGRAQFNSTIIYGFYKDFDITIPYNAYSVCSISIEGLT